MYLKHNPFYLLFRFTTTSYLSNSAVNKRYRR